MLNSKLTDLFAVEITQLHTFSRHASVGRGCKTCVCSYVANLTQFDAPKRSRNGLQARFAANGRLLYSDTLPIRLVVVSGVVAVVRREFAVQTNRFGILVVVKRLSV